MTQGESGPVQSSVAGVDPDRLFKEALFYLQRSEPNMAAHVLRRILELKPRDPRCLSYLGLCMAMVNRRSNEAVELCNEALKAGYYDAVYYRNLGKVYLLRGNRRRAFAAFVSGLKVEPRNRDIIKELRSMGLRQGSVFSTLPRSHGVNRFAGRVRYMLRRLFA